jgi:hypothetical protein
VKTDSDIDWKPMRCFECIGVVNRIKLKNDTNSGVLYMLQPLRIELA